MPSETLISLFRDDCVSSARVYENVFKITLDQIFEYD